jgi:parallel beta-helix repeat protein
LLALFLTNMIVLSVNLQPAKASATIYIRADGSVDPPGEAIQRNGDLYTFTSSISDSIAVERDSIVIDGNGYSLWGSGVGTGISLAGRENVTVKNMQIKNFAYGISLGGLGAFSSYNSIIGNNITQNAVSGVYFDYYSNYNSITGNNITKNNNGIYLYASSNNNIGKNNIAGNSYEGISLCSSSDQNSISKNNIASNWYGIGLEHSANNNIYGNNFVNNAYQVRSSVSTSTWDNAALSKGNYWSDYTGTDNDGDGVGNTPHAIGDGNSDRFPRMTKYNDFPQDSSYSTAVQEPEDQGQTADPADSSTPPAQTPNETPQEPSESTQEDTQTKPTTEEETTATPATKTILVLVAAVVATLIIAIATGARKRQTRHNMIRG